MATYFTDFDEFSTGNTSTNLTGFTTALATDWTSTIVDQGGGDHAVRFTNVGPTGDGVTTVAYDAFDTAGAVEAYATIITGTTSDQNAQIGPALIASDGRCYGLRPNAAATATTWRLALFSATTGAISSSIGTAFSFTEPAAGSLYHAVVGRDASNNIYAYMWLDGASRPGSPNASASNTTLTNVKPGLHARDSSDDPMTFTRFGAGTGGDAAPESDPGGGGGSHPNKLLGKFGGKLVGKAA